MKCRDQFALDASVVGEGEDGPDACSVRCKITYAYIRGAKKDLYSYQLSSWGKRARIIDVGVAAHAVIVSREFRELVDIAKEVINESGTFVELSIRRPNMRPRIWCEKA